MVQYVDVNVSENSKTCGFLFHIESSIEFAERNLLGSAVLQTSKSEHEWTVVEAVFTEGENTGNPIGSRRDSTNLQLEGILLSLAPFDKLYQRRRNLFVVQPAFKPHVPSGNYDLERQEFREFPIRHDRVADCLILCGHEIVVQRIGVVGIERLIELIEAKGVVRVEYIHRMRAHSLTSSRKVQRSNYLESVSRFPNRDAPTEQLIDLSYVSFRVTYVQSLSNSISGLVAAAERYSKILSERSLSMYMPIQSAQCPGFHLQVDSVQSLWLASDNIQRSTQRVASGQGSLWSANHFDAFKIDQVHVCTHGASQIDSIQINADSRIRSDDVIL